MPRAESKSVDSGDESKSGGGESKGGGGGRELDTKVSDDDFDRSSDRLDDVERIKEGEIAIVMRSDRSWRYAQLDGKEGTCLEFRVGRGEDDYKLFCPEEFENIRRLDVGRSGGGK